MNFLTFLDKWFITFSFLRLLPKVAVLRIINSQNMHPSKEIVKLLISAAFPEECFFKLMICIHLLDQLFLLDQLCLIVNILKRSSAVSLSFI